MEMSRTVAPDGTVCLRPHADKLDLSNSNDFKRAAAEAIQDASRVVLDMTEVEFVDSTGLGAILSCLRNLNTRNGGLRLCGIQRRVQVMFELVRMHRVLPLHADVDAALAAFQNGDAG